MLVTPEPLTLKMEISKDSRGVRVIFTDQAIESMRGYIYFF
jgi:hypothetical protein